MRCWKRDRAGRRRRTETAYTDFGGPSCCSRMHRIFLLGLRRGRARQCSSIGRRASLASRGRSFCASSSPPSFSPTASPTAQRLTKLRQQMLAATVDALIVPPAGCPGAGLATLDAAEERRRGRLPAEHLGGSKSKSKSKSRRDRSSGGGRRVGSLCSKH